MSQAREIKFRIWDFENKIMVYPKIAFDEKYVLQINCEYMGEFNGKTYDTIKMPKMQFTGLHDKNGKEIYEADIIKDSELVYELRFGFYIIESDELTGFYLWSDGESGIIGECDQNVIEVIGNIYENPESLNSEQNPERTENETR